MTRPGMNFKLESFYNLFLSSQSTLNLRNSRRKTSRLMLQRNNFVYLGESWETRKLCHQNSEFLMLKQVVHVVTTKLQSVRF